MRYPVFPPIHDLTPPDAAQPFGLFIPMKYPRLLTTAFILLACGAASANPVIVADHFDGEATESMVGRTAPTFSDGVVAAGGSAIWAGSAFFKRDGSVVVTNNTGAWVRNVHLNLGSYLNDAKGKSDSLFELSVTISGPPKVAGFLSLGFSAVNTPTVQGNFATAAVQGIGTIAYRDTGVIDAYGGLGTANRVTDGTVTATDERTLSVILDLREHNGIDQFGSVSFHDSEAGPLGSYTYVEDRNFGSILLSLQSPAFSPATMGEFSNLTLSRVVEADGPPALTITPAIAPATGYDLEWNSRAGKLYTLRTSTGLDTPAASWDVLEADIVATPPANLLNVQGDGPARFYALEEFDAPPPPPLLTENFDAVAALPEGWFSTGPSHGTDWQVGNPAGGYQSGPPAADSPPNCAGTNIGGAYTALADVSLISPPIRIPDGSGAILTFRQFIDTDLSGDVGSVRILDAGNANAPIDGLAIHNIEGDGTAANWSTRTLAMAAEAVNGKEIRIEFRFTSNNNSLEYGGFYIDDVEVTAAP